MLAIWIKLDSEGPVFYRQVRVGRNGIDFRIYKFRSMRVGSDKKGLLTVGEQDNRITGSGSFIRKYKLDELAQLINVLFGDMSLVGPRPEVRRYVDLYSTEQLKVLSVRPGITDIASIEYMNENALLAGSDDPEKLYVEKVMPEKLSLNLDYIRTRSFVSDIGLIFETIFKIG
ncbi:glycosyl transferase [Fulvitalea axinellae]|uniref:Glycosyl transferase n=2 Tax=Fulvitalea axinellae TaxID=1182444 RepID=A0AAU9CNT3_9BACT|nr:glycosyl transferase [Fulvitalea axinellae]